MKSTGWPAPAKLNLFLHITGRRPDGHHELQTVFQFINLIDSIDFTLLESNEVTRSSSMPGLVAKDDLVIRAALKLKQQTDYRRGVDIHVTKRIPAGGGLGGGSSDAATTLLALNQLWQTGLSIEELADIGLSLGADVPVFIRGSAAWAEGVGEKISPIEPVEQNYLVIHPGCSVPTAGVFNADNLTRHTPAITIRDFFKHGGINDCEAVVRGKYKEVAKALDWLNNHAPTKLTGTGSCVFAAFGSEQAATDICKLMPSHWQGFVVTGMNRSPLLARLANEQKENS